MKGDETVNNQKEILYSQFESTADLSIQEQIYSNPELCLTFLYEKIKRAKSMSEVKTIAREIQKLKEEYISSKYGEHSEKTM